MVSPQWAARPYLHAAIAPLIRTSPPISGASRAPCRGQRRIGAFIRADPRSPGQRPEIRYTHLHLRCSAALASPAPSKRGSDRQRIGIQAGRFPASQIQCDQGGRSGPSRDGADTSDASASPPLTALAIAARATKNPRDSGLWTFLWTFLWTSTAQHGQP